MGNQDCTKSARKKLALGHLVLNCCDYHMHIYGAQWIKWTAKKGKTSILRPGGTEWNGYMKKSSSGPFFQVHKTDVRNTKLLRIAKQQLVNGHHVEEGCQAFRGRVEMLCLHRHYAVL